MNKKCNKKGITLIALIITIIVMLILVAVTISMAVNGGLFGYAGNAAKDTELAKQGEQKIASGQIEVNEKKYNSPEDYINGVESIPAYSEDLFNPTTGVLTKNAIYTDSNTQTVEIPKGFAIVEDCDIINQGLVISDGFDSNGVSTGNEFVWIPVDYQKTNSDTNNNGLDDGFEAVFRRTSWRNNAREDGLLLSDADISEPYEGALQWELDAYNSMISSVQKHKGFYIGRYETGAKENGKIVVKRDKRPYVKIKWGDSMTEMGTEGAVYLSQNMYTGNDYGVFSTLCYDVMWDSILDFIIKDDNGEHNVTDSTSWGNYKNKAWTVNRQEAQYWNGSTWKTIGDQAGGSVSKGNTYSYKLSTGASNIFKTKNIYDIAGNVTEFTMGGKTGTSYRSGRGGDYDSVGSSSTVSVRHSISVDYTNFNSIGFRVALCL